MAGAKSSGLAVGDSEDDAFWTAFLRSLKAGGLSGVQLVIFDADIGLKQAPNAVLLGAAWQPGWRRCGATRGRTAGVDCVPGYALEADVEHEPGGATQHGGQTPHRCG